MVTLFHARKSNNDTIKKINSFLNNNINSNKCNGKMVDIGDGVG